MMRSRKTHLLRLVGLILCTACSGDVEPPSTGGVLPVGPASPVAGGASSPNTAVPVVAPAVTIPGVVGVEVPGMTAPGAAPVGAVVPPVMPLGPLEPTPVARLTNQEFVASVAFALGIARDSERLQEAAAGLPAEATIGGLRNDTAGLRLTQVVLANYMGFATVAGEIFLDAVADEAQLRQRLSCANSTGMQECISGFVETLRASAFRRPLTADERQSVQSEWQAFDQLIAETALDVSGQAAALRVLRLRVMAYIRSTFLSPDFLLQVETGLESPSKVKVLRPHEVATRLSYFLTGAPPDNELSATVAAGTLSDPAIRMAQADRLLSQPAARAHVVAQVTDWLALSDLATEQSTQELEAFIGRWFDEERPFSDFYQGAVPVTHADGSQTEEPFGVLGSSAFLASHTSFPTAAFITRGVFLVKSLLCTELPEDVPVEAFDSESATDKEVYEEHGRQPCATCHIFFDNYGAALHQFDAENGAYTPGPSVLGSGFQLFDVSGGSHPGTVDDAAGLAAYLASSEKAAECVADFWYSSASRRHFDETTADKQVVGQIVTDWRAGNLPSLKDLLRRVISSPRFSSLVLPE